MCIEYYFCVYVYYLDPMYYNYPINTKTQKHNEIYNGGAVQ